MLVYLVLVCITLATYSFSELSQDNSKGHGPSLPQNYTLENTFYTAYTPFSITYSPDQHWIVYKSYETDLENIIFFRKSNKYELSDEKNVKIGNSQIIPKISSFAFSQQGDLLFVGTKEGFLYVCKFSENMRNEDCLKNKFLGNNSQLIGMTTNSANKIVIGSKQFLWILSFTSNVVIRIELQIKYQRCRQIDSMWHPKAQKDILIISSNNLDTNQGFIAVYNITSKSNNTLITEQLSNLKILRDGQTLLGHQYIQGKWKFSQFKLSMTDVTKVGNDVNQSNFGIQSISLDGKTVAGRNCSSGCRTVVWSVSTSTNSVNSINANINPSSIMIVLKQIYYFDNKYFDYHGEFSADLNNVILVKFNENTFYRFSLCLNNTYFTNMQCLNCSNECKNCQESPDLCLQCNNGYFLNNTSCLKCNSVLNGCQSCSNQSYCLQCENNTYALINGSCLKCNNVLTGCQSCLTPYQCLKCVDNTYALKNGSCLMCNSLIDGCLTCSNQSQCIQCKTLRTLFEGKCIECFVSGCMTCLQDNVCFECDSGFNLSNGKCQSVSIVLILFLASVSLLVILVAYIICKQIRRKKSKQSSILSEGDQVFSEH